MRKCELEQTPKFRLSLDWSLQLDFMKEECIVIVVKNPTVKFTLDEYTLSITYAESGLCEVWYGNPFREPANELRKLEGYEVVAWFLLWRQQKGHIY